MDGFAWTSDWHLSRLTWQHRPRLTGDSFFALQQIVRFCRDRKCALLAGGDLLDKDRPDSAAIVELCQLMSQMAEAGLPVYYIQGQHERASPPWLASHGWPQHVHERAVSLPGGLMYGLDWQPATQLAEALARVPEGTRFFMCHQVWMEFMGNITQPEGSVHSVPHAQYVLTGDYHQHVSVECRAATGVRHVVSPGAMSLRNLGEPPEKAFWHWSTTRGGFESVPLLSRPYIRATVTDVSQVPQLKAAGLAAAQGLPAEIATPIYRLQYPADSSGLFEAINHELGQAHLWLEELTTEAPAEQIVLDRDDVATKSLSDIIRENITDAAVQADLLQLIAATDTTPTAAVHALLQQRWPQSAKGTV